MSSYWHCNLDMPMPLLVSKVFKIKCSWHPAHVQIPAEITCPHVFHSVACARQGKVFSGKDVLGIVVWNHIFFLEQTDRLKVTFLWHCCKGFMRCQSLYLNSSNYVFTVAGISQIDLECNLANITRCWLDISQSGWDIPSTVNLKVISTKFIELGKPLPDVIC